MHKLNPKVSIILTSFNHGNFISEAIESILNQSFKDFELIIWDDSSTDESWETIGRYKDERIKAYRNESRRRAVFGLNKAIKEIVKGDYIAIHHSDDVWSQDKLEAQVKFLNNNPKYGASFTLVQVIDEKGSAFEKPGHFYNSIFDQPNRSRTEWLKFFFENGNALCHPSVMIRREIFNDVGFYNPIFSQLTDFDLWIRILMYKEIFIIQKKLTKFRILDNEKNTSGKTVDTIQRYNYELPLLLDNFLKITNLEEISRIFSLKKEYLYMENFSPEFIILKKVIDSPKNIHYKTWALTRLSQLLRYSENLEIIQKYHKFNNIDYQILISNNLKDVNENRKDTFQITKFSVSELSKIIKIAKENKESFGMYGAGEAGATLLHVLLSLELKPKAIFDQNYEKIGKLSEITVYSPLKIKESGLRLIIIASVSFRDEINSTIKKNSPETLVI